MTHTVHTVVESDWDLKDGGPKAVKTFHSKPDAEEFLDAYTEDYEVESGSKYHVGMGGYRTIKIIENELV